MKHWSYSAPRWSPGPKRRARAGDPNHGQLHPDGVGYEEWAGRWGQNHGKWRIQIQHLAFHSGGISSPTKDPKGLREGGGGGRTRPGGGGERVGGAVGLGADGALGHPAVGTDAGTRFGLGTVAAAWWRLF